MATVIEFKPRQRDMPTLQEKLAQRIALNSRRNKVEQIKAVTAEAVKNWREKQEQSE